MSAICRSVLFVPGDDRRKIAKAAGLPADAVIVDLEDAVAVSHKDSARDMLAESVAALRPRRTYVRVNALATGRGPDDARAAFAAGADGIVVPKIHRGEELRPFDEVAEASATAGQRMIVMIETAAAVRRVDGIAEASRRVERLALGIGDLTHDLGLPQGDGAGPGSLAVLDAARVALVMASRAAGLAPPLDGPLLAVRESSTFARHCRRAREMAFAGVLCLHPDQVTIANRVMTPSGDEVAAARRIIEAFAENEREGQASIVVDGLFVDYPIAEAAAELLERVAAIATIEGVAVAEEQA